MVSGIRDEQTRLTRATKLGRAEAKAEQIHLLRRKLKSGMSAVEIAEWMELDEEYILKIREQTA